MLSEVQLSQTEQSNLSRCESHAVATESNVNHVILVSGFLTLFSCPICAVAPFGCFPLPAMPASVFWQKIALQLLVEIDTL
jgi:hypothetical protein